MNAFNHPWTYQLNYVVHPPALVSSVLSRFLADHVTGHLRLLVTPYWVEASWLSTFLSMLEDILH